MSIRWQDSEIVVEANDGNNDDVTWQPISLRLRGRYDPGKQRIKVREGGLPVPEFDIPGMLLALDVKRARLRIIDPLSFPENRHVISQVTSHRRRDATQPVGEVVGAGEVVQDNLPPDRLATFWWHLRKDVALGAFRIIHGLHGINSPLTKAFGKQPPGRVRLNFAASGRYDPKRPDNSTVVYLHDQQHQRGEISTEEWEKLSQPTGVRDEASAGVS